MTLAGSMDESFEMLMAFGKGSRCTRSAGSAPKEAEGRDGNLSIQYPCSWHSVGAGNIIVGVENNQNQQGIPRLVAVQAVDVTPWGVMGCGGVLEMSFVGVSWRENPANKFPFKKQVRPNTRDAGGTCRVVLQYQVFCHFYVKNQVIHERGCWKEPVN